ncbi:MAG TPA: wax ester/triacylglycerol synthase domain-containing protein [Micromonosporaceae bacterium]|nr:wax ester/triacylglycerol synthase domain-containing protein [Micromonosporaceae bacterium]
MTVRSTTGDGYPQPRPAIERTSPIDLMALASELPDAPAQVAAVLVLGSAATFDLAAVRGVIGERARAVPRLRQRLIRAPLGCGRPVWVDDPHFDIRHHIQAVRCPAPGDETALLGVVADMVARRLPANRPLWSATLVTALAGGGAALIVTLHHVVADGIGGLAVLAHLVDGIPTGPGVDFPRGRPDRKALFLDALGARLRAVAHLPAGVRRLRAAIAELAASGTSGAPRSSLNQPTGVRRSLAVVRTDLALVQRAAHAHGATVNDVVLTAVTGALHRVLHDRGENVNEFVISVPTSARRAATANELGNQVGVMPVPVTVTGDLSQRLTAVARTTRTRKPAAPSASAAVVGPAFRALAWLGAMRWFVDRQRLVTTFVTNLRGPADRLSFLAAPITDILAVSPISGNVTVAFAALSYAGSLVVTVIADPWRCPDLPLLVSRLQDQLDQLSAEPGEQPQRAADVIQGRHTDDAAVRVTSRHPPAHNGRSRPRELRVQ